MKLLLALALLLQAPQAAHFDSSRAWEHLRQLVAIGPRPSGSPAIEQARKYIKDQLAAAGVPSVDIIDLEYDPWHTANDTLDAVSARSLQIVGDVVLAALPQIEARVAGPSR